MSADLVVVPYSEAVVPVAPAISGVTPTSGSNISPTATIQFDLTVADASDIPLIFIWADYRDRQMTEVVYDGVQFEANFAGTKTPIANGYRITFSRTGGFLAQPDIRITAVSGSGGIL
jgi:uncharacterized protein YbaA (DUF1428 family)